MTARHKLLIYCVCLQYIRLFILQAFLPSRRRDCHANPRLYQPFQNRTIPRSAPPHLPLNERSVGFAVPLPCTITLASPRKRGGGTADIIFWLAVQYSDSPTFTILKLFRAVTVGIVNALEAFMIALLSISISYAPSSLSKTTLSLALHHHPCLPCQREVD